MFEGLIQKLLRWSHRDRLCKRKLKIKSLLWSCNKGTCKSLGVVPSDRYVLASPESDGLAPSSQNSVVWKYPRRPPQRLSQSSLKSVGLPRNCTGVWIRPCDLESFAGMGLAWLDTEVQTYFWMPLRCPLLPLQHRGGLAWLSQQHLARKLPSEMFVL